jgi:hypothetical protein
VQDQPVVGVLEELLGHQPQQAQLHRQRRLALGDARAVGDAEDVRVHGHGGLAEGGVEHHVGGLAADAGQGLQRLAVPRHLAAVLVHQHAAGLR